MKSDAELREAFAADGYLVERLERSQGFRGILARSARDPARRALYLEGDAYTQGYLTGLLARPDVQRMAGEFVDNVVPAFVAGGRTHPVRLRRLKRLLLDMLRDRCMRTYYASPEDLPPGLRDEIRGLAASSGVPYRELFLLNTGIDFLLSYVYTGARLFDWAPDERAFRRGLRPRPRARRKAALARSARRPAARFFRVPFGCNAFSLGPNLTEGARHYLGRDFMFPTAGVFQDTCCLVVRNPSDGALPTVSVSAPGFVGSVTAMNSAGLGVGVDMVPGAACDPRRPGINSLLLVRSCAEHAASLRQAVDFIAGAPRGVSWLYVLADGRSNKAAIVEAASRSYRLPELSAIPEPYRSILGAWGATAVPHGEAARDAEYAPPQELAELNARLFAARGRRHTPEMEAPRGRYHVGGARPWKKRVLPRCFYFPPQRESRPDLLVAGNQYLTPGMRISSMSRWLSLIAGGHEDDFQWRYDELANRLLEAVDTAHARGRLVTLEEAKALVDFLSPRRAWPAYYAHNARCAGGRRIEGAIALCDLTALVMHGYFRSYDEIWVQLTLPAYVP